MSNPEVGVKLVADGSDQYLASLGSATDALLKLAAAAEKSVAALNGEDDAAKKGGKSSKQLGDDAEQGSKGLNVLQQMAVGAARKVGELLVNAAQQAGQAILKFVGDTINKAGDFEQQMNRFASVTGDSLAQSGQSLDDFKQLFISLGRELPVSTAEVQQAAIEMAKGGIDPATIAAGGLRDVLNLAAAGEVGIAEAAEIASKQLGVWVDQAADSATKAAFLKDSVNLLSQAANASTVDVDDLALGLANTGKSADIAGLSFRETVTSMALISSGFSSAADAGTSFKTLLTRLQPTTDSQADAFKNLNLLTEQGTSKFYDAQGAFIGMDKAAQLLQDSLKGMSAAQKSAALNAAFGADAIRAAGMLADAGAEGYQHMAEEMAKAGSAAVQAAKKQQGFNVAMDNISGSVEAFQITVGSALLPVLTDLVNLLASGINAITDYADATLKGETFLAQLATTVKTLVVPAITGVTAALTAYAIITYTQAIPGLIALIPEIAASTEAFFAQATAIGAAMLPYAAIAVAIAGVAYAYQNFTGAVTSATQELLNSKQWWIDSTAAIDDYATQAGDAKKALDPFAASISELRTEIQADTEALGKHEAEYAQFGAASGYNRAQLDAELASIVAKKDGLIQVTAAYTEQSQALIKQTAQSMTATQRASELQSAESDLSGQTSLTAKDIEDLGKKIEKTFQDGQDAVQKYATSYSEFASGVEARSQEHADKIEALEKKKQDATTKEQKQGIDDQIAQVNQSYADQEQSAAQSYARQQEAQKQHLGQMLIDYTVSQAQLGNISKEKAAEITGGLEKEYGLQESSTATTFLHMAGSIDKFASESGGNINDLIGDLRNQGQQAKDTQKAMDDYAKEYVATQTNNFLEGKMNADDYIRSLESIPKEINTTVTTTYRDKQDNRGDDPSQQSPGRASGGPVSAGQAYMVGEHGPEMIVPASDGYVLTSNETRRAMASGAQLGAARSGASIVETTIINVDARGSSLTMADITRGVQVGLEAAGRGADVQVRAMG